MSFLNKKLYFYLLLIPSIIMFIWYVITPTIMGFMYSLTYFEGVGTATFVGLKNYLLLFRDSTFLIAIKNTFIMLVESAVLVIPLSLLLALIVNRKLRGSEVFKTIYFAPIVIAPIITGLVWVFIFDPTMGLINTILNKAGLGFMAQQWIGGLTLTPYAASIVYVWSRSGFFMAIFLAGLKMIPGDFYEASTIDGATKFQEVMYITIPMLYESFKVCGILVITETFKVFESIYVLTNGGPNHYSESIVTLLYNVTFTARHYGYGMAMAVVETLLAVGCSLLMLSFTSKKIV